MAAAFVPAGRLRAARGVLRAGRAAQLRAAPSPAPRPHSGRRGARTAAGAGMHLRVEPFTISVDPAAVADLRARLAATRWPGEPPAPGWQYGADNAFVRELADYWGTQYDWAAEERRLNSAFQHFTLAGIEGVERLHFLHQRSPRPDARPLLLIHGWPGSFYEYHEVIPQLTDPGDGQPAFHVVVPSLPGFAFSSAPTLQGFGPRAMAAAFHALMQHLGYARYFAAGGDWGAYICKALGMSHADGCAALLLTSNFSTPALYNPMHLAQLANVYLFPGRPLFVGGEECARFQRVRAFMRSGNGYYSVQTQQPQTLAFAMADSPAGLLAWLGEKFHTWSEHSGDLTQAIGRDALLTNASLYWLTKSAASSFRIYYEAEATGDFQALLNGRCAVPTGMALFPVDINALVSWARPKFNLRSVRLMPAGGHFAALEKPAEVAAEIRRFLAEQHL